MRNESLLIKQKIDEILSMDLDYSKVSILVIDSCSDDDTKGIAERHLINHEREIPWRVLEVNTPGKSFAVISLDNIESVFS